MEDEELQNTIDKISNIMLKIGAIDIYGECSFGTGRRHCQGQLNRAYDDLFKLKKHLLFVQKKGVLKQ